MFWKDIKYHLKSSAPNLHDVARFSYTVNESMIPENLQNDEHKVKVTTLLAIVQSRQPCTCMLQLDFGKLLFEDIACMIYDMIDARRQWRNFLSNIKLYHVPPYGESNALSQAQGTAAVECCLKINFEIDLYLELLRFRNSFGSCSDAVQPEGGEKRSGSRSTAAGGGQERRGRERGATERRRRPALLQRTSGLGSARAGERAAAGALHGGAGGGDGGGPRSSK